MSKKDPEAKPLNENATEPLPGLLRPGMALADAGNRSEKERSLLRLVAQSLSGMFERPRAELVCEISDRVASGDHLGAARLIQADDRAWLAFEHPNGELVDVLYRVDVESLDGTGRLAFIQERAAIACAAGRYQDASVDVRWLLENEADMAKQQRWRWHYALALASKQRGHHQSALLQLRKLVGEAAAEDVHGDRAVVYRCIAELLPPHDSEGLEAAQTAADLFLVAGDRVSAATATVLHGERLQHLDPHRALKLLQGALQLVTGNALLEREARARAHQTCAMIHAMLRNGVEARGHAEAAVVELRSLVGHEAKLSGALRVLARLERSLGNQHEGARLEEEVTKLLAELGDPELLGRDLIGEAIGRGEPLSDTEVRRLQLSGRDADLWLHLSCALSGVELESIVLHCDQALEYVRRTESASGHEYLIPWTLARAFQRHGERARAKEQFERARELAPWCMALRDAALHFYWDGADWEAAILLLQAEVERLGALPGLMFGLGRSYHEAGELNAAATALAAAVQGGGENAGAAKELLCRVVEDGGVPAAVEPKAPRSRPRLEQLREALDEFAGIVSSQQRMSFWRRGKAPGRHRWRSKPEEHAKQLLMTSLATEFGESVEVLEEVPAGAGRIDLYLRFSDLRVVVELKMCGSAYSMSYALKGLEQLAHYMEAKGTHVGFLIVFDGRSRDFNKGIEPLSTLGAHTIYGVCIDVRSKVGLTER